MAKDRFQNARSHFSLVLGQTKLSLDFVKSSQRLFRHINDIVDRNQLINDKSAAFALSQFMRTNEVRPPDIYSLLIVDIGAGFEQFVRSVLTAGVAELSDRFPAFDQLPVNIKNQNYLWSGRALTRVCDPPRHMSINAERISKSLGECSANKTVLNSHEFCLSMSTLDYRTLERVLARIGVKCDSSFWDDIANEKEIQTILAAKKVREAAIGCKDFLDRSAERRNQIVHRGDRMPTIVEDDVATAVDFFESFAKRLAIVLPKFMPKNSKKS